MKPRIVAAWIIAVIVVISLGWVVNTFAHYWFPMYALLSGLIVAFDAWYCGRRNGRKDAESIKRLGGSQALDALESKLRDVLRRRESGD